MIVRPQLACRGPPRERLRDAGRLAGAAGPLLVTVLTREAQRAPGGEREPSRDAAIAGELLKLRVLGGSGLFLGDPLSSRTFHGGSIARSARERKRRARDNDGDGGRPRCIVG